MAEQNVISVVLVAVKKDEKILLLRREKEPLKGYWGVIGGKLKNHESIAECATRETEEETGIEVEFVGIKGVLHERLFDNKNLKYGLMLFFVEVKPNTFDLVSSNEGEVKWFELSSIDSEKIILSDLWMIKNLLSKKGNVYNVVMEENGGKLLNMRVDEYGN